MQRTDEMSITVTSPLLPSLDEFIPYIKDIWERKWITNNGYYHQQLEIALQKYLGVANISIFTNGTIPLLTALQALELKGEIITTPYSFVATTHSLIWRGITPVFVDVDPIMGNLDPTKIEAAITPATTAIMPVHVYGNPCDIVNIKNIADAYNLKVIYDAAHAFGVRLNGQSILNAGNMSTLSFHATKTYNTIEGGALITHNAEEKKLVDYLKNFGFADEITVVESGINGKMDEIRAAYGLLNLKAVDTAIAKRRDVAKKYLKELKGIRGIRCLDDMPHVDHNYSYFPIFIDKDEFGISRDALYEKMKTQNIFGRRYFFPLISSFAMYKNIPSANPANIPNAVKLADTVLCLPMHADLSDNDIDRVLACIH